jgi:uncharacterized protein YciI
MMHRLSPLAIACLLVFTSSPAAQDDPKPSDPYGVRLWQLVLLQRGPAYDTLKGEARTKAMQGHKANIVRLAKFGQLRLAGPFEQPKDAPKDGYAGLFLLDVKSKEEALELCQSDPSIKAGLFKVKVLSWYGPSDITYRGDTSPKEPWPVVLDKDTKFALFNGEDLTGWHSDIPRKDKNPDIKKTFIVRDGLLVSLGMPQGHLITDKSYQDYRLVIEYRWPGRPGNCGILVHASKPRMLYKMFPQSIECQMNHGHAGDFWCIGEDIKVPDMLKRRGPEKRWGVVEGKARRIRNLTDNSEKPLKEWNRMVIECRGNKIDVWVNGDLVNNGFDCTVDRGQIAIQAEGAECEFRKVELRPLEKAEKKKPEDQKSAKPKN